MAGRSSFSALIANMTPERRTESDARVRDMAAEAGLAGLSQVLHRPRRVRYSLAAMLVAMTIACGLLAFFRPIHRYSVTAYFKVSRATPVASSKTWLSPQEIEQHAADYLAMATSDEVIIAVLAEPAVAKLDVIKRQSNAAAWLKDRLRASFPGAGEILELRLSGHGNGAKDDEKILNAVIDAYQSASDRRNQLAKPNEPIYDVTLFRESTEIYQSR